MAIEQIDRDQRDASPVDAKTDVGPGTGHAYTQHGVATGRSTARSTSRASSGWASPSWWSPSWCTS